MILIFWIFEIFAGIKIYSTNPVFDREGIFYFTLCSVGLPGVAENKEKSKVDMDSSLLDFS